MRADDLIRPKVDENMVIDELHIPNNMSSTQIYDFMKGCIGDTGRIVDLVHYI